MVHQPVSKSMSFELAARMTTDSDAVVYWLSMRIHNARVVSSIPPCVAIKMSLMKKVMGNIS